jgi:hypothetical protein
MPRLQVVRYTPAMFGRVAAQLSKVRPDHPLCFRGFVDAYYASSEFCQLNVALDEEGEIAAVQGVEWAPFEDRGKKLKLGIGSNFRAFRRGGGACLLMSWFRSCDAALVFGGSADMHSMMDKAGWRYFTGINDMLMNRRLSPGRKDGVLKGLAKRFLRSAPGRRSLASLADRLPGALRRGVSAAEVDVIDEDLLDFSSAFGFRLAPDRRYLAWRFGPEVPYVRYRTLRITRDGRYVGYAVLLDRAERVVVAHADGSEPVALAAGIVKAISAIAQGARDLREAAVTSAHPAMQQLFAKVGFVHKPRWDRPLALGGLNGAFGVVTPVTEWMASDGWSDGALRPPFLEAPAAAEPLPRAA